MTAAPEVMEREVVISRVFDAPRELLFKAWTEPERLKQWWGPHGWTNPSCAIDLRPGGEWHIIMRGPDGPDFRCGGVYSEVTPPERLVFTNSPSDQEGKLLLEGLTTVTFTDQGSKTLLTVTTRAVALVPHAARMLAGMEIGWKQSIDRLEKLMGGADTSGREIVVSRVFDAPRSLVWKAWTDPAHQAKWWGPVGFTSTIHEMDLRPGGGWSQTMRGPDGQEYPNRCVFIEVVEPERIVYTLCGGKKGTPEVQHNSTWTFEALGSKTRLTIHMVFETAELRDYVKQTYRAEEGGHQTLGRLAEYLAAMK